MSVSVSRAFSRLWTPAEVGPHAISLQHPLPSDLEQGANCSRPAPGAACALTRGPSMPRADRDSELRRVPLPRWQCLHVLLAAASMALPASGGTVRPQSSAAQRTVRLPEILDACHAGAAHRDTIRAVSLAWPNLADSSCGFLPCEAGEGREGRIAADTLPHRLTERDTSRSDSAL